MIFLKVLNLELRIVGDWNLWRVTAQDGKTIFPSELTGDFYNIDACSHTLQGLPF
jgi:hypothetical protein